MALSMLGMIVLAPQIGLWLTPIFDKFYSVFGVMDKMDKKGVMLNSAFAVSAAFTFGGHLAFTIVFDSSYVTPMIIGKLISGVCAIILAAILYKKNLKSA